MSWTGFWKETMEQSRNWSLVMYGILSKFKFQIFDAPEVVMLYSWFCKNYLISTVDFFVWQLLLRTSGTQMVILNAILKRIRHSRNTHGEHWRRHLESLILALFWSLVGIKLWSNPRIVVLKLQHAWESPRRLIKTDCWVQLRASESIGLQ